jgi:hypothetical protein
MATRKQKQLTERMKSLSKLKHLKFEITPEEELDNKIRVLNTQINNCEGDLKGNFRGNIVIENKLRLLKLRKLELEDEKSKLIPDKIVTVAEELKYE